MKAFQVFVLTGAIAVLTGGYFSHATEIKKMDANQANARPAVLVELFTSEGCSSCPPADELLTELSKSQGVQIVPLALHVDYWNRLGWADPFSTAGFSDRQRQYAAEFKTESIYTPQMVVNGTSEFVGSDRQKAANAIATAAKSARAKVVIDRLTLSKDGTSLDYHASISELPADLKGPSDVMIAITQDGLTSDIKRGENAGRKLVHTGVTRLLEKASTLEAGKTSTEIQGTLKLDPAWNVKNLKAIVFVQQREGLAVRGVASSSIE